MLRTLTLAVACSLALTTTAEARDGGERTGSGALSPVSFFPASLAGSQPAPLALAGLSGRNQRFAVE